MEGAADLPLPHLDGLLLGAHRLSVLTDPQLAAACGVSLAFTGRQGGVSVGEFAALNCGDAVGDDPDSVARNRALVLEALGAAGAPCVVPRQVHGTDLVAVTAAEGAAAAQDRAGQGADGVLVEVPGVAALLNFADCLPVVLVAPGGSFAVVHAGWRGAVASIARKAAERLAADAGCPASRMNAYLGPHIRSCCFEVGEEVAERFRQAFGDGVLEGSHVSLARAVAADLQAAGLDPRRIADGGPCTRCHPYDYFSYRASDGHCGRHCAVAFRAV